MINSGMLESQQGYAVLEDVDKGTFARFVHWAYSGAYHGADYVIEVDESECSDSARVASNIRQDSQRESDQGDTLPGYREWSRLVDTDKYCWPESWCPASRAQFKDCFKLSTYESLHPFTCRPLPRANASSLENYSSVFLSHVRLYAFADKYDIHALKMLALKQLHLTLSEFTLYPQRVQDVVQVIKYVWKVTGVELDKGSSIRELLRRYICVEFDVLISEDSFGQCLEDRELPMADFLMIAETRVRGSPNPPDLQDADRLGIHFLS